MPECRPRALLVVGAISVALEAKKERRAGEVLVTPTAGAIYTIAEADSRDVALREGHVHTPALCEGAGRPDCSQLQFGPFYQSHEFARRPDEYI